MPENLRLDSVDDVDKLVNALCTEASSLRDLWLSEAFRTVLVAYCGIEQAKRDNRLPRLINLFSFGAHHAEAEFIRQQRGPLSNRAAKAIPLIREAAEILGTRHKFLPSDMHPRLNGEELFLMDCNGDLGDLFFTLTKALEAARTIDQDIGISAELGFDATNVAQGGVAKDRPDKAVDGFLSRQLCALLPDGIPDRYKLAEELFSAAGHPIKRTKIRSHCKRGY